MYGHTYSKSMDQPGKVASPARRQLNRKNEYFPAVSKHDYCCTAMGPPFFRIILYKCQEVRVHGTICVVCQNMITAVLLWTHHFSFDLCLSKCIKVRARSF